MLVVRAAGHVRAHVVQDAPPPAAAVARGPKAGAPAGGSRTDSRGQLGHVPARGRRRSDTSRRSPWPTGACCCGAVRTPRPCSGCVRSSSRPSRMLTCDTSISSARVACQQGLVDQQGRHEGLGVGKGDAVDARPARRACGPTTLRTNWSNALRPTAVSPRGRAAGRPGRPRSGRRRPRRSKCSTSASGSELLIMLTVLAIWWRSSSAARSADSSLVARSSWSRTEPRA